MAKLLQPLTDRMWHTLEQICAGQKRVDVRSGMALHRRGLAKYEPCRDEAGYHFSGYIATEKGMAMNNERQVAKVVQGSRLLRQIVALWAKPIVGKEKGL